MTKRAIDPSARARADGDPDELVAWCEATGDVIAFREALRRISPERWASVHARLDDSLHGVEPPGGGAQAGYADDRARRGRSAARVLKRQMLVEEASSRTARDPDARALRRVARLGA